jgi:plastocyanin
MSVSVQRIRQAPRIFLVIPGLLIGFLVPNLLPAPRPVPRADIGMFTADFNKEAVTLHRGERLTLINDSNAVHVVGPGRNSRIASPERGVPMTGFHLMQTNGSYTTGPWMTVGTFYLTCTVHPGMDLRVVVVP